MKPDTDPKVARIAKARLAYPNLFRPRPGMDGGEPMFSAIFLISPEDCKKDAEQYIKLRNAAWAALGEKWPGKPPAGLRNPFRAATEKGEKAGFLPGWMFITAKSRSRPVMVDQHMQPIMSPDELYPGCIVRVKVRAYAYDQKGNKGVSFGLGNIQKIGDAERLDNRRSAEDDFEPVEGEDSPFKPGGGGPDDDIPF